MFFRIRSRMAKRSFVIIMLMAVFFRGSLFSYPFSKERGDFIRVGLTKEFYNRPSLTIKNKEIRIGFSRKNKFFAVELLRSDSGITIKKNAGMFRVLHSEYTSYQEAKKEADLLKEHQIYSIPTLVGLSKEKGRWKLYLNDSKVRKETALLELSKQVTLSEDFLEIRYDEEVFFVDAKESKGYPQFEPVNRFGERLVKLEEKRYRGRMEIGSYGNSGVTAVNIVRIEDYVKGVIPLEMGYHWHISAMKAQAVCARSFGVATAGFGADSRLKKGYKLNNKTHQSYGGYDVEGDKPNRAVRETLGELVTYQSKVVRTFFYSTSGGATESPENVWGRKLPYLKSVPDIYENKPEKKNWTLILIKEEISKSLSPIAKKKGMELGSVLDIKVKKVSKSGRVISLTVIGEKGEVTLNENEVRTTFDLPSTKFTLFKGEEETDRVTVAYRKRDDIYKRNRSLKNSFVLSKNGVSKLSASKENGEQVVVLSSENRKGFYLGEVKKDRFYFVGAGFGHGVGLSQSGARGMAEAGYSYKDIIKHYFIGVEVH